MPLLLPVLLCWQNTFKKQDLKKANRCYRWRLHHSRYGGWSARCHERWSSQPISADTSHAALPSVTAQCSTGSTTNDTVLIFHMQLSHQYQLCVQLVHLQTTQCWYFTCSSPISISSVFNWFTYKWHSADTSHAVLPSVTAQVFNWFTYKRHSADTSHAVLPSVTAPCSTGSPTNDTVLVRNNCFSITSTYDHHIYILTGKNIKTLATNK